MEQGIELLTPAKRFSEIRKAWIQQPICLVCFIDLVDHDATVSIAEICETLIKTNCVPELIGIISKRLVRWREYWHAGHEGPRSGANVLGNRCQM